MAGIVESSRELTRYGLCGRSIAADTFVNTNLLTILLAFGIGMAVNVTFPAPNRSGRADFTHSLFDQTFLDRHKSSWSNGGLNLLLPQF